jgi:RNase P subunit RPR2
MIEHIDGKLDGKIQTLFCSNCNHELTFKIKTERTGNLIIVCDNCGHKHCRRVVNGVVTSDRWDTRSSDDTFGPEDGIMARTRDD